ncbi:hypothetical protein K491DRAFT_629273, partial [Lophiostoma macrostomum CBS 122681]
MRLPLLHRPLRLRRLLFPRPSPPSREFFHHISPQVVLTCFSASASSVVSSAASAASSKASSAASGASSAASSAASAASSAASSAAGSSGAAGPMMTAVPMA